MSRLCYVGLIPASRFSIQIKRIANPSQRTSWNRAAPNVDAFVLDPRTGTFSARDFAETREGVYELSESGFDFRRLRFRCRALALSMSTLSALITPPNTCLSWFGRMTSKASASFLSGILSIVARVGLS